MLRVKCFNEKKNYKLNNLLNYVKMDIDDYTIKYVINNLDDFVSNKLIKFKSNKLFDIIKEEYLGGYILCVHNICIIHFDNLLLLNDFEDLYKNTDYLFRVYFRNDQYHVICVSKYTCMSGIINFLNGNECNIKYVMLYHIYGNILVMNRKCDEKSTRYVFVKMIGNGKSNIKLERELDCIISTINMIGDNLPVHYMAI